MKVMVGLFNNESNANIPLKNDITNYDIAFGIDCIQKMRIGEVFEKEEIEMIPSIYASATPSGVIKKETFEYIEACFLRTVKEHLDELDGIYLHMHGASEVEELGSGEHHIIKKIREIVGQYMPLAVVCDPHGNLCKEYVESCNILRSYRESPHTDAIETRKKVAKMLCDFIKNRQNIHSVYRKLPLILGGEQSVSTDEPVKSINKYMDELEKDPKIKSCSWHVGYIRHDTDVAGCSVVVVPEKTEDQKYAEIIADKLANYVWNKRKEFHYTGNTAMPDEALQQALKYSGKPVFITDSGDNVTSGATGWNTYILRQVLNIENLQKKFLFAQICDPNTYHKISEMKIGAEIRIDLGMNYDDMSKSVNINCIIKSKGELMGFLIHDHNAIFGHCITVSVKNKPIDIIIGTTRQPMCEIHQYKPAGVNIDEYDVIVVKLGYNFPELIEKGELSIMSLTKGATVQDTKQIPFKRIMRPIYPIDEI